MRNWRGPGWQPVLTTPILAAITLLMAACSDLNAVPVGLGDGQQRDMSQTIERLQKIGPQLQREMDAIEKLHPDIVSDCSPAYPEKCIPPAPPDLDCRDIALRNFWVLPPDPHQFDPDGNGIGCEG